MDPGWGPFGRGPETVFLKKIAVVSPSVLGSIWGAGAVLLFVEEDSGGHAKVAEICGREDGACRKKLKA